MNPRFRISKDLQIPDGDPYEGRFVFFSQCQPCHENSHNPDLVGVVNRKAGYVKEGSMGSNSDYYPTLALR